MPKSVFLAVMAAAALCSAAEAAPKTVEEVFSPASETERVMQVEAAIARAQARRGVISEAAAKEIAAKASLDYAPLDEIAAANARLNHRMEALLHVWRARLSEEARDSLHFGATTVDIYDTTLSLQLVEALSLLTGRIDALDERLSVLAAAHRDAPMTGRTLGQYALPMTFGKKVAVWIGELDRHRERFCQTEARVRRSVILKGPVGSYAGLGPKARAVETDFAKALGMPAPYADDWHGARDVYAEAALDVALLSRSLARIGQEIFLLQSSDIGEVREALEAETVSSSSMPQKVNPVLSEALINYGRVLPRQAEVLLDDVVNFYERDNTARPNAALAELMIGADNMLKDADDLIARLRVDEEAMRARVEIAGAPLRAQAATQVLTPQLGRETAAAEVKAAAAASRAGGDAFLDALLARPAVRAAVDRKTLEKVLDPFADLAGAGEQVDAVIRASAKARETSCGKR
ncbi:MAG: lyase family protein [Pseudomonadota bacterium]|nr:lyase family protein [Pseudomonadota bacterium]